jgi:hypothetical protein
MAQRGVLLVVLFALAACIPSRALREGDAAATRGDWRTAEHAYRRAVSQKPNDKEIARKYADAKGRAIIEATRIADACEAGGDLLCVEHEVTYVVEIDPANVEAMTRRARVREGLSEAELAAAHESYRAGDPIAVWAHLDKVREFGVPERSVAEVSELDRTCAALAAQRVGALLEIAAEQNGDSVTRSLAQASQLARLAAAHDSVHGPLIVKVEALRNQMIDREIGSLLAVADMRLAADDYAGAADALETASRLRPGGPIASRARYARAMASGEEGARARTFEAAAHAFREAIATGVDTTKAKSRLDQVEPRVYRIRFDSIAIQQYRPGTTQPWVGRPWWKGAAPAIAAIVVSATEFGAAFADEAAEITEAVVNNIPDENRPKLAFEVELPDRRVLRTANARKGLYAVFDAEIYVMTNMLDTRTLKLHVLHERSGGDEDVAIVNVPLGPIVAGTVDAKAVTGSADALRGILFSVEPAPDDMDGGYDGLVPRDTDENRASARSRPGQGRARARLDRIDLAWQDGADGWGTAEPYLKMSQDGQEILKTTVGRPGQMSWTFSRTGLFVGHNETIEVRLMEADAADDDTIAIWSVAGSTIEHGAVELTTAKGSRVDLRFAPASTGPR